MSSRFDVSVSITVDPASDSISVIEICGKFYQFKYYKYLINMLIDLSMYPHTYISYQTTDYGAAIIIKCYLLIDRRFILYSLRTGIAFQDFIVNCPIVHAIVQSRS